MLRGVWRFVRDFLNRPRAPFIGFETSQTVWPPHPANVPGPFYVQDGCCISCGVWEDVAPDLLAWIEEEDERLSHCYVSRQPQTDAEFERMKQAMEVGEVDCIRVRACKAEWMENLRRSGLGHHIDTPSVE